MRNRYNEVTEKARTGIIIVFSSEKLLLASGCFAFRISNRRERKDICSSVYVTKIPVINTNFFIITKADRNAARYFDGFTLLCLICCNAH
jgi:hypothetical protein